MKSLLKLICISLTALLMLPVFTACKSEDENKEKTPVKEITIAADKKTEYVLVYPAAASDEDKRAFQNLRSDLRGKLQVFFDIKDDSEPAAEGAKEILLGNTNRVQSAEAYNRLGEEQYGIFVIDNQVAITANFAEGISLATQEFVSRYVKDSVLKLAENLSLRIQCDVGCHDVEVSNMRGIGGDDPYVVKHEGSYYYCWAEGGVKVAKIDNLDSIVKDNGKQVFSASSDEGYHNVWAPELHYVDGAWYIYVAMCKGTDANEAHRMYCLKGTTQDPTDPFEMVGQVTDSTDHWAIDGTVFKYKDELYTIWSGWETADVGPQHLYIAHMSNPWTIDSERVLISSPVYEEEGDINEGPAVLIKDDTIIVVYSGHGSWADNYHLSAVYCDGDNLMKTRAWTRVGKSLLSPTSKSYGPGHCCFTTADDGSLWVVYHANLESGTGWGGRSVRIQPVEWDGNIPKFGTPQRTVKLPKHGVKVIGEVKD